MIEALELLQVMLVSVSPFIIVAFSFGLAMAVVGSLIEIVRSRW